MLGFSVAATTVSGAVYGFAGTPYDNSGYGGVRSFYFATPTSSAIATATASASSPTAFAGMYSVMMSGYQFGAAAGNNGGSSTYPNYFMTVSITARGASVTLSTRIASAYSCIEFIMLLVLTSQYFSWLLDISCNVCKPSFPRCRSVSSSLKCRRCDDLQLHPGNYFFMLFFESVHYHWCLRRKLWLLGQCCQWHPGHLCARPVHRRYLLFFLRFICLFYFLTEVWIYKCTAYNSCTANSYILGSSASIGMSAGHVFAVNPFF